MGFKYTTDQIKLYQSSVAVGNSYHDAARIAMGQDISRTPSHLEREAADVFLKWLDEGQTDEFTNSLSPESQETIKELAVADQPARFSRDTVEDYRKLRKAGHDFREAARRALKWSLDRQITNADLETIGDLVEAAGLLDCKDDFRADHPIPESSAVDHPKHYNQYKGLEVIDLVEQMNFNLGNAVKYITRAGFKDPDKQLEDLEKAIWYTRREIERLTNAE